MPSRDYGFREGMMILRGAAVDMPRQRQAASARFRDFRARSPQFATALTAARGRINFVDRFNEGSLLGAR